MTDIENGFVIISEFNRSVQGFLVSSVDRIINMNWEDIDLVVPHQPNRRILDRMARLAGIDPEKIVVNIQRFGNMSSASCAVALDEALRERARPGDRILLVAAGAGYTAGAALLVVDEELLHACRSDNPAKGAADEG